jgi:Glycosyl hydrolases family 16
MSKESVQLRIAARSSRLVVKVAVAIGVCFPIISADPANALDLGAYRQIWADEFNGAAGARPAQHWFFFDGWGSGKWRDAHYTDQDAYLDGTGNLYLRSRVKDGKFMTSYLQTYSWQASPSQWTTFGPGRGKYIEARVDLSRMQARGPWAAFWLFDPSDTYDGNPSNGTEIDIMEYIVDGGWMLNRYNVANHWGSSEASIIDAGAYGKNMRSGWHTFGLEWTSSRLTYYMDGKQVWSTTRGVSTSNEQALMLTIEYDQGPGDAWGINQNVFNDAAKLPDGMLVDYVRVYEKK